MNNTNDRLNAIKFIKKHFLKSEVKVCSISSYSLKHILQYSTNVYMEEHEFVSLMVELGYKRTKRGNWKMWFSNEVRQYLKGGGLIC